MTESGMELSITVHVQWAETLFKIAQKNCFLSQSLNFAKLHPIHTGCCHVILIYGPIGIIETDKWNGTFNYCLCAMGCNSF